ncbi:hypothetical protein BVY01_04775 [bacterium I07]|nr:hypothetical protein BVY01_04775 [bacterium I07]
MATKKSTDKTPDPPSGKAAGYDLKKMVDDLNFLHQISQKISENKPLPKLLMEIMESSKLLMDAEASSLLLYEPADKKLYFHVATGQKGKLFKKFSVDLGQGIAGWVAKHKKPLLIEDCYQDSRFSPDYDKKSNFRTKSMICVPMVRKRKLLGVIQVINKRGRDAFDQHDLTLFETLASQCAIAIENQKLIRKQVEAEALERELDTARDIQQTLLPDVLPEYEDIEVAALLIPANQVGGDYYNIVKIGKDHTLLFVADVAGKGIPAALVVSTIDSCLSSYLKLNLGTFDLMTLVTGMNKVLMESTTSTKFATCWFGLYEHKTGKILSINAGHNPPVLFKKSQPEPVELNTGGLFLGSLEVPYQTETIQLDPADVLVFYSDGITEAWDTKKVMYRKAGLIKSVSRCFNESATDILAAIAADVTNHVGRAEQSDDITCGVLKVK